MKIIVPLTITSAMIGAATSIAEPAASETAWVSAGTYVLGDRRIRATTHREYECLQDHTGRTALPENDAAYWLDIGPTQRFAPFDSYTSTQAEDVTSITFVLSPGFFNALALYGLTGSATSVTVKDAPAGSEIYSYITDLSEPPAGWYEYLFGALKPITKFVLSDIPIRPTAELTITVTAGTGEPVGIGMIVVGDLVPLIGDAPTFGGTLAGASAEPVTYSYIKTAEDGTTTIVRRHKATSMRANVVLPRSAADNALRIVQEVLDVPVAWIATAASGYQGLNVFGLGSASLSYDGATLANMQINVKGLI